MKRIDHISSEHYLKAAVYGKSGSGKTTLGVSCPNPLILASERQSVLSIKQAAKARGIPVPPVLYMESVEDYRRVIRAFSGKRDEPFAVRDEEGAVFYQSDKWPESVVIDSLTDTARMVKDDAQNGVVLTQGKDGLPSIPLRFWDVLGDRMTALIKSFRNLPAHVLFICLVDDREVGEDKQKTRVVTPSLPMRKLSETLCAASNVVGYSYRAERVKDGKASIGFGVMFSGPEHLLLKGTAPLRAREVPNFERWVQAVYGNIATDDEMPLPSAESMESAVAGVVESEPQPKPASEQSATNNAQAQPEHNRKLRPERTRQANA